jgi:hypothetical protein
MTAAIILIPDQFPIIKSSAAIATPIALFISIITILDSVTMPAMDTGWVNYYPMTYQFTVNLLLPTIDALMAFSLTVIITGGVIMGLF